MEAQKKISVMNVLSEGISLGVKNSVSLLVATVLWIVTIWIPYLNVGTTIAMTTIPIELSKGKVISPVFIFDSMYRKFMGEYFTLLGLMVMAIIPAFFFMVIPAIVISIGWSLAIYILLDKGVAPGEAMVQSNKATYGYKWTIFGVQFVLGLIYGILSAIFGLIPILGVLLMLCLVIAYVIISMGCTAVIYRNLVVEESPAEPQTEDTQVQE